MWRRVGWDARAAGGFIVTGTRGSPKAPQNSVCFLFAPVLFCPQRFQQDIILHSGSRGSGHRQHERLIRYGDSVQADLKPVGMNNYVFIKLTIWYYQTTLLYRRHNSDATD